ncbi:NUDIX domain-containing protein [Parerythrobacter aurantius]|uniref:NUDIX hydrolase n=1 Tax=Parerythrobacter aurantius TaxID=3127706 RepID=UPI00325291E7
MLHLIPSPVHRALLPLAHAIRHRWRRWRKTRLYGCGVIICNLEGEVLMLRHSYGPAVWSLPGGGIGRGEDPAAAALREVYEELRIELARVTLLGIVEDTISGSPHTTHLFHAVTDQYPQVDRREVVEARFFPRHSLPEPQGRTTRTRLDRWRSEMQGQA